MDTHDVISAFIDNEPFDAGELARALSQPGGRDLLLDLVALRALVQEDGMAPAPAARPGAGTRTTWMAVGFLAASIIFAVATALVLPELLRQRAPDAPPRPDRVVTFDTAGSGNAQ
jgi:hypothetical protein